MTTEARIYVWPAPGLLIRNERTLEHIPPDGAELPVTRYVRRRIQAGDLRTTDPRVLADSPSNEALVDEPKKSTRKADKG